MSPSKRADTNQYIKVRRSFWTGRTGRLIRKRSTQSRVIALYLMTGPASNPFGLIYNELWEIAHWCGISTEEAEAELEFLQSIGFLLFSLDEDAIFIPTMAKYQVLNGTMQTLDHKDNRVLGFKRRLEHLQDHPFYRDFLAMYAKALHIENIPEKPTIEGASKGLGKGLGKGLVEGLGKGGAGQGITPLQARSSLSSSTQNSEAGGDRRACGRGPPPLEGSPSPEVKASSDSSRAPRSPGAGHADSTPSPEKSREIPKNPDRSRRKRIGFRPPPDLHDDWRADVAQRLVDLHPKYFPKGRGLDLHTAEGMASHFNQWPKSERAGMVEPVLKALAWRLQRSKVKGPAQFLKIINRPGNEGTRQWLKQTQEEMSEPRESWQHDRMRKAVGVANRRFLGDGSYTEDDFKDFVRRHYCEGGKYRWSESVWLDLSGPPRPPKEVSAPEPAPKPVLFTGKAPDGAESWEQVKTQLEKQVGAQNFEVWFLHTEQVGEENGRLIIQAPNKHFLYWLGKHYRQEIEGVLRSGVEVELRCGS